MRTGLPIRPIVIAHRGASGYLPEHTLPAKALAYAMGADYLEQDIVVTRDDELIVLHDVHLDRTTDVARVYPDRHRDDGRYYARDFNLDEICQLRAHERVSADGTAVFPGRYPVDGDTFRIHTLAEELEFIANLQQKVGRPVGIYPEIKKPAWHREEGVEISLLVLETLQQFGYSQREDPVYLQCFDENELIRIRASLGSKLKLIQLVADNSWGETDIDYDELQTQTGLQRLAKTVDGIGPWIEQLYNVEDSGNSVLGSKLVSNAHSEGLAVHPYTLRRDSLPKGFATFDELLRFLFDEQKVDGVFTDFPDLTVMACENS